MESDNLKHKTKAGIYWNALGNFSNYGMQFIIGIVMARLLSPEDYGITALPAVFLAVAGIFASAGFGTALIRKSELTEEDLSTAFYYSTGVGLIIYVILFFSAPSIASFYNVPVLSPLIRVTSLGFIYGPLGTPQYIILTRRLDFKTPTKVGIICKIFSGLIGIVMAYYGYGVWALTISGMIGGILGLLLNFYVVRWYPKAKWSRSSFKYLWGFGNKFMGSQILDTLYTNITPVFIGKYYSFNDLGVYNRAESYAKLPSQNFCGIINSVTFPVLSKIQDDQERLANSYRRILVASAFIVFPAMMLLAALAKPLIILLITEKWISCVFLLQLLSMSMILWPIHTVNLSLILSKGRSDWFFKLEIIKKTFSFIILLVTLPLGIEVICYGRILTGVLSLFVNSYYTGKILHMNLISQLRDLLPTLILSIFAFIAAYCTLFTFSNLWMQLLFGSCLGVTVYLLGARLLRLSCINDIKYMISLKK